MCSRPAGFADDLLQPRLDIHVDVLERPRKRERARLDFAADLFEPGNDRVPVGFGQNPGFGQHGCMGDGAGDILRGTNACRNRSRR